MERYLGTHAGISESFVAKILEKTKGIDERDAFVKNLGSSFKETEGMRIEIVNKGKEQRFFLSYEINGKSVSMEIDSSVLYGIISEREEFEKKIRE